MPCPVCGGTQVTRVTRDLPYTYQGRSILIPEVTGDHCPDCGETVLKGDEANRYSAEVGAL